MYAALLDFSSGAQTSYLPTRSPIALEEGGAPPAGAGRFSFQRNDTLGKDTEAHEGKDGGGADHKDHEPASKTLPHRHSGTCEQAVRCSRPVQPHGLAGGVLTHRSCPAEGPSGVSDLRVPGPPVPP